MGQQKKEHNRRATEKASATGERRLTKPLKGENFYRDASDIKRLNVLRGGRPTRNADGKIIKEAQYQSRLASGSMGRVQPDRR